jgi:hypothetical protein
VRSVPNVHKELSFRGEVCLGRTVHVQVIATQVCEDGYIRWPLLRPTIPQRLACDLERKGLYIGLKSGFDSTKKLGRSWASWQTRFANEAPKRC